MAMVNIFYNDLSETQITAAVKFGPLDLISTIGGILDLFLGYLNKYMLLVT